ncbi:hypothetical protein MMC27_003145 [Xylographa pallens]|nr:hypothetical protein [Xylographa pallens]
MGSPPRKKAKQEAERSDEERQVSSCSSSDDDQVEETREEGPMTQAAETENERREIQDIMQEESTVIVLLEKRDTICEGSPCLIDEDPDRYICNTFKDLLLYRLSLEWLGMFSKSCDKSIESNSTQQMTRHASNLSTISHVSSIFSTSGITLDN